MPLIPTTPIRSPSEIVIERLFEEGPVRRPGRNPIQVDEHCHEVASLPAGSTGPERHSAPAH